MRCNRLRSNTERRHCSENKRALAYCNRLRSSTERKHHSANTLGLAPYNRSSLGTSSAACRCFGCTESPPRILFPAEVPSPCNLLLLCSTQRGCVLSRRHSRAEVRRTPSPHVEPTYPRPASFKLQGCSMQQNMGFATELRLHVHAYRPWSSVVASGNDVSKVSRRSRTQSGKMHHCARRND